MAIALKSGELYFITEVDLLTGKRSGYYKIGLVKDARQGDSSTRLDEHQTGNPRKLEISAVVTAAAIEQLEGSMHLRYATQRIRGEWFKLGPRELAAAVADATALSAELDVHVAAVRRAARFAGKVPASTMGRAKVDDVEWHLRAVAAKQLQLRVRKLKDQVTGLFREESKGKRPIDQFAVYSRSGAATIDKAKLEAARPDLVARFTKTSESARRAFKLLAATPKQTAVVLPKDFIELDNELVGLLEQRRKSWKYLEQVHLAYLDLLRFQGQADWILEIATAELMASCGPKAGIEGLCSWAWEAKSSATFDKTAFAKAHPRLSKDFLKQPAAQFKVLPMRGYTPSK